MRKKEREMNFGMSMCKHRPNKKKMARQSTGFAHQTNLGRKKNTQSRFGSISNDIDIPLIIINKPNKNCRVTYAWCAHRFTRVRQFFLLESKALDDVMLLRCLHRYVAVVAHIRSINVIKTFNVIDSHESEFRLRNYAKHYGRSIENSSERERMAEIASPK